MKNFLLILVTVLAAVVLIGNSIDKRANRKIIRRTKWIIFLNMMGVKYIVFMTGVIMCILPIVMVKRSLKRTARRSGIPYGGKPS